MAKKSLNLKVTSGKDYDLDQIEAENRINSTLDLVVQVVEYDPEDPNSKPNPDNLKVGQIWLAKKKSS